MTHQPDLRTYLDGLKAKYPQSFLEFNTEIPIDYTSTALAFELEAQGKYPALLFNRLQGTNSRMAANLFASRQSMAYSINCELDQFNTFFGNCLDDLVPAQKVETGPVQEVIWEGGEADLTKLPIPRHFVGDAGAYITAGMIAAQDPDTGIGNLAYARLQVHDKHKLGISLHSRQHLWEYHRRAAQKGKDLPVAVIIGTHPAVMLAAAAKMGIDEDEYDLAGALLGDHLEVCKAKTVDINIPANAELVIEGYILADQTETEGPFGEYTGYSTDRSTNNVLVVNAITMRKDAIFVDIVPGNSADHLNLGRASKEAWVYTRMKEALPFFIDFHYPNSGTHFHCYVRIDKTAEGQAKQAGELLLGLDHYVKFVVIVDKDIDPAFESQVMWAMATRMQADRDVEILSGLLCNQLDPSSIGGVSAKMIVDATASLDMTAKRIALPQEVEKLAKKLLELDSK